VQGLKVASLFTCQCRALFGVVYDVPTSVQMKSLTCFRHVGASARSETSPQQSLVCQDYLLGMIANKHHFMISSWVCVCVLGLGKMMACICSRVRPGRPPYGIYLACRCGPD
jgi:hypothetical protein